MNSRSMTASVQTGLLTPQETTCKLKPKNALARRSSDTRDTIRSQNQKKVNILPHSVFRLSDIALISSACN